MTHIQTAQYTVGLSVRQSAILITMGAILWFLAAMLLRALAPLGIYEGSARVLLYILIIPGTVPFVLLLWKLAAMQPGQLARGLGLATATATVLDGAALAWLPALYSAQPENIAWIAGAGATILWGAGVGIFLGFWLDRILIARARV